MPSSKKDRKKAKRTKSDQGDEGRNASGFLSISCELRLALHPSTLGDPLQAVREQLDRELLRYDPQLDGVLVAYSDIELLGSTGRVLYDRANVLVTATARVLLFAPKAGAHLRGRVNQVSASHVGLLVHGTFNASLSRTALEGYEFDSESETWYFSQSAEDSSRPEALSVGADVDFIAAGTESAHGLISVVGVLPP